MNLRVTPLRTDACAFPIEVLTILIAGQVLQPLMKLFVLGFNDIFTLNI